MKNLLPAALLFAAALMAGGCARTIHSGTDPTGYSYTVYGKNKGRKPQPGEVALFHYTMMTANDSVVAKSHGQQGVVDVVVGPPEFQGDIKGSLMRLAIGDSAVFTVSADSFFRQGMPPFFKSGDKVKLGVRLLDVMSNFEFNVYNIHKEAELERKMEQNIENYIESNGLKAEKLPSGLYVAMQEEGTGQQAEKGRTVAVHYTGTLLNGQKFQSSRDRGQPITFTLGVGQVIAGWDEGIALLREGGKAVFIIPPQLGYGERGAGPIPPNSVLVFDIELVKVQ